MAVEMLISRLHIYIEIERKREKRLRREQNSGKEIFPSNIENQET